METIRRDKLRRLIEAGRVVMVGAYHFDDMTGESRQQGVRRPVAMNPGGPDAWRHRQHGVVYLFDSDLTSKSGTAYKASTTNPNRVTLIVHSNSNFDLEILPEPYFQLIPVKEFSTDKV